MSICSVKAVVFLSLFSRSQLSPAPCHCSELGHALYRCSGFTDAAGLAEEVGDPEEGVRGRRGDAERCGPREDASEARPSSETEGGHGV